MNSPPIEIFRKKIHCRVAENKVASATAFWLTISYFFSTSNLWGVLFSNLLLYASEIQLIYFHFWMVIHFVWEGVLLMVSIICFTTPLLHVVLPIQSAYFSRKKSQCIHAGKEYSCSNGSFGLMIGSIEAVNGLQYHLFGSTFRLLPGNWITIRVAAISRSSCSIVIRIAVDWLTVYKLVKKERNSQLCDHLWSNMLLWAPHEHLPFRVMTKGNQELLKSSLTVKSVGNSDFRGNQSIV